MSVSYLSLIRKVEKNVELSRIANIESGKRPAKVSYTNSCEYPYPILGATGVIGYTDKYLTKDKILVIGRVGTHGVIQIIQERAWASDNTLFITTKFYSFCWNILKNIDYKSLNKGSTQPLITQTDMNNVLVAFPSKDELNKFEEKGSIVLEKRKELKHQTQKLTALKKFYLKKFFG